MSNDEYLPVLVGDENGEVISKKVDYMSDLEATVKEAVARVTNNTVSQNEVEGDLVVGLNLKVQLPQINNSALVKLVEKSKQLSEDDEEYRLFIEELNSFLRPRPGRDIVGLKNKLKEGGREDLLEDAFYLENRFAIRVGRGEHSRSAQAIYLHCLSKINSSFNSVIKPLIKNGTPVSQIDKRIFDEIILPIYDEVAEVDSSISTETIKGMLFFITGKCHIRWA